MLHDSSHVASGEGKLWEAVKWPVAARGQGGGGTNTQAMRVRAARLLCRTLQSQHSPTVQHEVLNSSRRSGASASSGFGQQADSRERLVSHRHHNSQAHSHTHPSKLLTQRVRCVLYDILWDTYGFTRRHLVSLVSVLWKISWTHVGSGAVIFTVNVTIRQTTILFLLLSLFCKISAMVFSR